MSNIRKQVIVMSVLIVLVACAGYFARNFNNSIKENETVSNEVSETSKTMNFFAESRMQRENAMEVSKTEYNNIISNKELSKKLHENAATKLMTLVDTNKKENTVETLIKGRGYEDALCMISGNSVEVCVKTKEELTDKEVHELKDIIVKTAKVTASNIYIKPRE